MFYHEKPSHKYGEITISRQNKEIFLQETNINHFMLTLTDQLNLKG